MRNIDKYCEKYGETNSQHKEEIAHTLEKGPEKRRCKKVKVNSEKSDLHPKVILYSLVCTFPPKSLNLITLALEQVC